MDGDTDVDADANVGSTTIDSKSNEKMLKSGSLTTIPGDPYLDADHSSILPVDSGDIESGSMYANEVETSSTMNISAADGGASHVRAYVPDESTTSARNNQRGLLHTDAANVGEFIEIWAQEEAAIKEAEDMESGIAMQRKH
jgi:hypothetical protein